MPDVVDLTAHRAEIAEAEIAARVRFVTDGFALLVSTDDDPVQAALCLFVACARLLARHGIGVETLQGELLHHHADAAPGRAGQAL